MITITTEIKVIEESLDFLTSFGTNIDLKEILIKKFKQELPIDISCPL